MVDISFFLVGKSRGSAAATAEVEFAGKREVTRDRRPLCVITSRPARTVLFNRTKVQEVHTLASLFHTPLLFSRRSPSGMRAEKRIDEVETRPSEKTRSSEDVQIFERANDISGLGELRRSNLRISLR